MESSVNTNGFYADMQNRLDSQIVSSYFDVQRALESIYDRTEAKNAQIDAEKQAQNNNTFMRGTFQ